MGRLLVILQLGDASQNLQVQAPKDCVYVPVNWLIECLHVLVYLF